MFSEAIVSDAKRRAKDMVNKAKKELDNSIEERKKYWEKRLKEEEEKAKKEVKEMGNEKIAWAELEAKKIKIRAFEKVVERVIDEVIKRFKVNVNKKEFVKIIENIANNVKKEIGNVIIRLPKDSKIDINGFKVKKDLRSPAGFIIESEDKKVIYRYTIEDMIDLYRDDIRRIIYEKELR